MGYDLLPENKHVIKSTLNLYFIMHYLSSICNRLSTVILSLLYPTPWGSDRDEYHDFLKLQSLLCHFLYLISLSFQVFKLASFTTFKFNASKEKRTILWPSLLTNRQRNFKLWKSHVKITCENYWENSFVS